ncbi:DUF58 domain-containing protein [Primorskyibacter sp. S87]|uniref:DUF58 domain-containing protein n=1 Tax=Primorskyibacter sp. S87 TaxID=3415126 RepID=UPI003C7AF95E
MPDPQTDPRIHVDAQHLRDLGAQARLLSLLPKQPARSVLNGRHASKLRGRGLDFEELRNYLPGDDIRSIDWKVTARSGEPYVRVYTEERDRPALLLVDQRQTMFFGSQVYMKSVVAAEAAAIAAHRILAQGDRIGAIVFGDDMIAEHRPQRRPAALDRVLGSIGRANSRLGPGGHDQSAVRLDDVLQQAAKVTPTNALIAVFSDFDGLSARTERLLAQLNAKGDLILFHVADPTSAGLPNDLRVAISDGELQATLDATDETVRNKVEAALSSRLDALYRWSRRHGFPVLPLTTAGPALGQLMGLLGHLGTRNGGGT